MYSYQRTINGTVFYTPSEFLASRISEKSGIPYKTIYSL